MPSISSIICDTLYIIGAVAVYAITDLFAYISRLLFPVRKQLKDDIVLITGAGGGLGRALCIELAKHCSTIIGWDMNETSLQQTAKVLAEKGHIMRTYVCDLSDRDRIMSTAEQVIRDVGPVTILINNAGVVSGQNLVDLKPEEIENCFKVNVFSQFYTIQAFLPYMTGDRKSLQPGPSGEQIKGHIVSIASIAGIIPGAGLSDYCASKAACLLMSESFEQELALRNLEEKIHVTRICPYLIDTQMFRGCGSSRPWLLPIVDTTDCARRIVQAIQLNERDVFIYARYAIFPLLKSLLPHNTLWKIQKLGGSHHFLAQLHAGRAAPKPDKSQ